jgi:hypothetical protein
MKFRVKFTLEAEEWQIKLFSSQFFKRYFREFYLIAEISVLGRPLVALQYKNGP